jgi:hypothetical protein
MATNVVESKPAMEVVESKPAMEVMEVISPIATVVRITVIAAKIAAGVLGYATTGAGRAQTTSTQVCRRCFLISNHWRCGKC